MSNRNIDNCGDPPDIAALPNVIAVSGITDYDKRSPIPNQARGYGKCMDVLAPTRGGAKGIPTTSVRVLSGGATSTYFYNFGGTSSSTPIVAGVVGLLKSLDASLSPTTIQRVLQDTSDRVNPYKAKYSSEFGFSDPTGIPKYGYGRINAFEAVQLIAPQSSPESEGSSSAGSIISESESENPSGRGGQDLILRDNKHDWGNTEQPSNIIFNTRRSQNNNHQSVDIKIDVLPFQASATTPKQFAALVNEEPEPGEESRVYIRVRNRGPVEILQAELKLHSTVFTDTLPDLPTDFWSSSPVISSQTSNWSPIGWVVLNDIGYSGASVAGCPYRLVPECLPLPPTPQPTDNAQISMFSLDPMNWDSASGEKLALLAFVNSADDPVQALLSPQPSGNFQNVLETVALDNNVTLWVAQLEDPICCEQWIRILLIASAILAVALIIYVIWKWSKGNFKLPVAYVMLIIVLVILLVIWLKLPCCYTSGFN